jgi:hypothetical protein
MGNELEILVKESNLEPTKAKFLLDKFQDYFEIAGEWERKAKNIVVTRADQHVDMQMARTGRLFLREKRISIEKARKELKEQSLREGKAIDGIANVLKALIVPIEEYLDTQERFIDIQEENKKEMLRIEMEKRIEEERIAKEKADAEERDRIRVENERLKKEAFEREKQMQLEREKQERLIAEERAKADAERKAIEEKNRIEREKQEKKFAEERAKAESEKKQAEEKARIEKEEERAKADAERKEKERLESIFKNQIKCPKCGNIIQRG